MSNMKVPCHKRVEVRHRCDIGHIRRLATELAKASALDEETIGKVAIVATELASNLVKHTSQGGELLLHRWGNAREQRLELVSVDRSPGISNPSRVLQDGVTTAASAGIGLGAVRRLSHEFDLFSQPGLGTGVIARWNKPADVNAPMQVGAFQQCMPGEEVCGDAWAVRQDSDRTSLMVCDGLGHGPLAAEPAGRAVELFLEHPELSPARLMEKLHHALRPTRGAAVAIAEIDPNRHALTFCGVGNISASVLSRSKSTGCVSFNGTVGAQIYRIREQAYDFWPTDLLVMHSDGLTSRWNLNSCTELRHRDPAVIAAWLYRDFARGNDDVTVVVARRR